MVSIRNGARLAPVRLEMHLTDACNHNCPWCEARSYREAASLDTAQATSTVRAFAALGGKCLILSGGGEPLCHPYFDLVVSAAKVYGLFVAVVTNGQLLGKWHPSLCQVDTVRVSLDASDEFEHCQMHGSPPGAWATIVAAVGGLAQAHPRPELGLGFLVNPPLHHYKSIDRLLDLAEDLGVDYAHIRPLCLPKQPVKAAVYHLLAYAEQEGEQRKVRVYAGGKRDNSVFELRDFDRCWMGYLTTVVGANGDFRVCCDRPDLVYGNVHTQPFKEAWLGPVHRRLLERLEPKGCSRCVLAKCNTVLQQAVIDDEIKAVIV